MSEADLEQRLKQLEARESALKKISDVVMKSRAAAGEVDARLAEVTQREAALNKIAEVVERRRGELEESVGAATARAERAEARASELQQRLADASAQSAGLQAEIERLQAELAAQPAAPAPQVADKRSLFGRRRHEPVSQPQLLPPHEPEPEPAAPEPVVEQPPPAFIGRPTLPQLEHLALEAERAGRPEAEEWLVYITLLRDHAWLDGTIPPQFDDILRDVFHAPV